MKEPVALKLPNLKEWKAMLEEKQEQIASQGMTEEYVAIDKQLDILEKYIVKLEN